MRHLLPGSLLVAVAALGCQPASTAPATIEPGSAQPSRTSKPPRSTVAVAKCSGSALAKIDRGLGQVPPDLKGKALAAGLVELCKDSLDPVVAQSMERVVRDAPQPSDVDRLPEAVFQVVDLSAEDSEARDSFESAYVRLLADMRHRLTGQVHVPVLSGGSYPRSDDVEVILASGKRSHEGRAIAADKPLASALPKAGSRRFVAVGDVRDDSRQLATLLADAREAGFRELGVLVVHDGSYRVMPLSVETKADAKLLPMSMRSGGFYLNHDEDSEPPPVSETDVGTMGQPTEPAKPADVPAARPGADLVDDSRWDFEGLESALAPKLGKLGRPAAIGLKVEAGVTVGAALTLISQLPTLSCPDQPKAKCGIERVVWLP